MWLYSDITFSVQGGSTKKQNELHLEDIFVLMVWSLSKVLHFSSGVSKAVQILMPKLLANEY